MRNGNIPDCVAQAWREVSGAKARECITIKVQGLSFDVLRDSQDLTLPILRFLAGVNAQQQQVASDMWAEVRALSEEATDGSFELEAAHLTYETLLTAILLQYPTDTREQLKQKDLKVAEAARRLQRALIEHEELGTTPCSWLWREEYLEGIEVMLRGVPPPVNYEGWARPSLIFGAGPPSGDERRSAWLLFYGAPSIETTIGVLVQKANAVAANRKLAAKKRVRGPTGLRGRAIDGLSAGIRKRHPHASSAKVARIVKPLVELLLGEEDVLEVVEKRLRRAGEGVTGH